MREDDDVHETTDNVLEGLHQVDSHFIASTRTFLRKKRAIRLRLEAAIDLAPWPHYQKSFDDCPIGMKSFCLQLVSGTESLRLIPSPVGLVELYVRATRQVDGELSGFLPLTGGLVPKGHRPISQTLSAKYGSHAQRLPTQVISQALGESVDRGVLHRRVKR